MFNSQRKRDMIIEQPMGYGFVKHKLTADNLKQIWSCQQKCGARIHTSADYRNVGDKNTIVALKVVKDHTCVPQINFFNERLIDRESKKEGRTRPFDKAGEIVNEVNDDILTKNGLPFSSKCS